MEPGAWALEPGTTRTCYNPAMAHPDYTTLGTPSHCTTADIVLGAVTTAPKSVVGLTKRASFRSNRP